MTRFVLGTRGSALALVQAEMTQSALAEAWPGMQIERQVFVTRGDRKLDLSLLRANEAGGKGLFTRELEEALIAGTIDVAVHSLKDLPGHNPPGLEITAVLPRADVADVLITKESFTLETLPNGARIGTSSVRRARQLQWLRPDLRIEEWRGNVPTRLRKLGENPDVTGIVLAQAGLERLGFAFGEGVIELPPWRLNVTSLGEHLLPAIGQGAIALQSCAEREDVSEILRKIDHPPTHRAIRAEREFQRLLSGDCAVPVGVRTRLVGDQIEMSGLLFGAEPGAPATAEVTGAASAPEEVGRLLFAALSA